MPLIKTEVSARTRANVAYTAALLDMRESDIYGMILDRYAGGSTPADLAKAVEKQLDKKGEHLGSNSEDTQ